VVYSGWKHREDFSPYGEDNDEEAMEYGFPSWWTVNLKGGVTVGKRFDFLLAIENLLDQFYKPYASGISAPGRNFIITARFHL
jgi:hemoglobin/transferrin/lactoferrin receptor protein